MIWQQAIAAFQLDSINLSQSTIDKIYTDVRDFFVFCPKDVNDLVKEDVVDWHQFLVGKYKPNYVWRKLKNLKQFFGYLCYEEIRFDNPAIGEKIPWGDIISRKVITKNDYHLLMETSKPNLMHQAIISILYTGGLRPNELVKLNQRDIDWDKAVLSIYDDKKNKERKVAITYDCLTRIKWYLESRKSYSSLLFPSPFKEGYPIDPKSLWLLLNRYKNKLGISKQLSPIVFRYTYASNLHAAGFKTDEIAKLMGHDNLNTTRRYIQYFE